MMQAVALEPNYAPFLANAVWALEFRIDMGWPTLTGDDRAACLDLVRRALANAQGDAAVLAQCGIDAGERRAGLRSRPADHRQCRRGQPEQPVCADRRGHRQAPLREISRSRSPTAGARSCMSPGDPTARSGR